MSVKPLPHTLITAETRRSVARTIVGDASDTGALPVCSVVTSTLLLMLTSGGSDVIVTSLLQQTRTCQHEVVLT